MSVKIYYEEFVLGDSRSTTGRTITDADIVLHAGQSGDFYPHHMDEEWCKTQPFKKRIAHGTLIFSVGVGLSAGLINEVAMTYGYEKLRFIRPVFINDTIRAKVTIKDKRDHKKPGYGIVSEALEVFNQNDELVMVCEHLLLVEKKGSNG
ncbi:MaoC family dehydratase [Niabella sp. CJ426]|uniref:MaoC family dehydratase n=1 Tax=Niabella sp. CJ426 TaxID=3393740 RepID=UPI003CFE4982